MITQEQLKDVLERADALHRYLEIDKKKIFAPKLLTFGRIASVPKSR